VNLRIHLRASARTFISFFSQMTLIEIPLIFAERINSLPFMQLLITNYQSQITNHLTDYIFFLKFHLFSLPVSQNQADKLFSQKSKYFVSIYLITNCFIDIDSLVYQKTPIS